MKVSVIQDVAYELLKGTKISDLGWPWTA